MYLGGLKKKHRRLLFIGAVLSLSAFCLYLIITVFESNLIFYRSPEEILKNPPAISQSLRVGGVVEEGSLKILNDSIKFNLKHNKTILKVVYKGLLPSLFREGQETVVYGKLDERKVFHAKTILAKHDETYKLPEGNK